MSDRQSQPSAIVVTVDMVLTSERGNTHTLRINNYQRVFSDDESSGSEGTNEARAATQKERIARQIRQVEIRVSALFSSYTYPIGASRCFEVVMEDGEFYLQPLTPVTSQLNTRRQRGQMYRSLKRFDDKQGAHAGATGARE